MKAASDNYTAPFSIDGVSPRGAFDSSQLVRIGDDLRHLYDEVVESEAPKCLLELAEMIDACRAGQIGSD